MPQPTEHLAHILDKTGQADGTAEIVALIETGLKAAQEAKQQARADEGKELKTHPFVTDAGKECDRQIVYSLLNYPADALTTDSLVNFAVGSAVEEAFAGMLEPLGGRIVRELRVEIPVGVPNLGTEGVGGTRPDSVRETVGGYAGSGDDPGQTTAAERPTALGTPTVVSGRVDMLVLLLESRTMIELKSTSSRSMGWMLKRGANRGHIHQLNMYLHASQMGLLMAEQDQPLKSFDAGFIVYCVKDAVIREPPIHAFRVPYDAAMATGDLARLAALQEAAEAKEIPPIPEGYEWKKWPCGYCGFRTICWSGSQTQGRA